MRGELWGTVTLDWPTELCMFDRMELDQLKKEIQSLTLERQGELIAYLVQLRNTKDPAYRTLMMERLDDRDPNHWLTPDQFEERVNRG